MSKNDSSLQTTKQMLDELDALMEKMLSLPVNDLDEPAPFPEAKTPTLPPALAATLTLLERPAPGVGEDTSLYLSPPEPAWSHPAINPPHMTMPEPAPQPAPLTNDVAPPSVLAQLDPLLAAVPEPAPAAQLNYGPLMWINQAFDTSTLILGGAGDLLRSEGGRMLLGLSGLALTLAAVGWFLKDYLGWNW